MLAALKRWPDIGPNNMNLHSFHGLLNGVTANVCDYSIDRLRQRRSTICIPIFVVSEVWKLMKSTEECQFSMAITICPSGKFQTRAESVVRTGRPSIVLTVSAKVKE